MLRRTFLLGSAALTGARAQDLNRTTSLGSLAYVDKATLWLRELPDGSPRPLATGDRLSSPRFSPTGQWILFRDGERVRVVATEANTGKEWKGGLSESAAWIPGSDELVLEERTIDKGRNWSAWTSRAAEKTTLFLSSFAQPGEPRRLDETEGFFEVAGFTAGGKRLLYWRAPEMSASVEADGLDLYAVSTSAGQPRKLGFETLVHADMATFSPAKEMIAVTRGAGRETWTNKSIAIIDFTGGEPAIRTLTDLSVSAQLPAWSPDGERLAWSAGPDADVLYKQQLLASGRKTITVGGTNGVPREIPITPGLNLGASAEMADQCVRLRRIWVTQIGPGGGANQLTNDPDYLDEEPIWSYDGGHILFCRTDARGVRSIWLMRNDGSEVRQVAGPLGTPLLFNGYYGYTDWRSLFDWWPG